MSSQFPEFRERDEARLKAKLDAEARLYYAWTEGFEEGRAQGRVEGRELGRKEARELAFEQNKAQGFAVGELTGLIRFLEQLLGMTPTASDELEKLGLERLGERLEELKQIYHERQK